MIAPRFFVLSLVFFGAVQARPGFQLATPSYPVSLPLRGSACTLMDHAVDRLAYYSCADGNMRVVGPGTILEGITPDTTFNAIDASELPPAIRSNPLVWHYIREDPHESDRSYAFQPALSTTLQPYSQIALTKSEGMAFHARDGRHIAYYGGKYFDLLSEGSRLRMVLSDYVPAPASNPVDPETEQDLHWLTVGIVEAAKAYENLRCPVSPDPEGCRQRSLYDEITDR